MGDFGACEQDADEGGADGRRLLRGGVGQLAAAGAGEPETGGAGHRQRRQRGGTADHQCRPQAARG
eukprot:7231987-Pyramimonas_sp.AAC.1